jgi:hypothetical protein
MNGIVQPIVWAERELDLRETGDTSEKSEHLYRKIKQLLKESDDAKEKGHWKKAQDLLFELSKLTKNNVETNAWSHRLHLATGV